MPDRAWLEEAFGVAACRPLSAPDVPSCVTDEGARRFLTGAGLPVLDDLLHLRTVDPGDSAFRQAPQPESTHHSAPGRAGPYISLGTWMHSGLLLDGSTGRVLRDGSGGPDGVVAGSSLARFVTMVRLFDEHRRAQYPCRADRQDAAGWLRTWCHLIAPAAMESEVWEIVLGTYEFEDSTWDFASLDGRAP